MSDLLYNDQKLMLLSAAFKASGIALIGIFIWLLISQTKKGKITSKQAVITFIAFAVTTLAVSLIGIMIWRNFWFS